MITQKQTRDLLNQRQPSDRELALDELENVSGGIRKAAGNSTSGTAFLRFDFGTVFTTK